VPLRQRLWRWRNALCNRIGGKTFRTRIFSTIYSDNLWGDTESRSGRGSSLTATKAVRRELPALLQQFDVNTLLDAPCGDFVWMLGIIPAVGKYIGVDIVPELIARNAAAYGNEQVSFM